MKIQFPLIGVVGAGAMGRGVAQMMVQAGSQVRLFDAQPGTANAACQGIAQQWQRMVGKNRLDAEQAAAFAGRLQAVDALAGAARIVFVRAYQAAHSAFPFSTFVMHRTALFQPRSGALSHNRLVLSTTRHRSTFVTPA